MVFLPEQVLEYDQKRAQGAQAPQMELPVSDERSVIDWVANFLKNKPSTYQDIYPEFIKQLSADWKKHEIYPGLSVLLEANFLRYDGIGDVPNQIRIYLSTNHDDLRDLTSADPRLIDKAKNLWYVPDWNQSEDLEKKREKSLLEEFSRYKISLSNEIKDLRLEVLHTGFRAAWTAKDYSTILAVSNKLPAKILQEDESLLALYSMALMHSENTSG
jgi:hypothetical protein